MKPSLCFIVMLCLHLAIARGASAQGDYRVLPPQFNADKQQQMMRSYLRRQVQEAMDERSQEVEQALAGDEQLAAYQQSRRDFLRWTLGDMPPRTPLEARVTGTVECQGYTIEKVLYQSQPGFYVTANVYRPAGEGPFPALLHPCGHSENGKAASAYQLANQLFARNGFLVLCFDPIGQGERKQILAPTGKPIHQATGEHQQLGVAPILLGQSLASLMVWDGVRGIDYLCSRPDVDSQRIGCTGNSGGGNLTSFLMAYDDRIAAAAPGCFLTTHRHKNESPGPGDAEQNLFAQIRERFDHGDFILARAPKPTLILAATHDFVPIEGTWESFRQAKRVYTQCGYPERIELVEANARHGFSQSLREGAVRFFARWLQDRLVETVEEPDPAVHADAKLQVTPGGQVLHLPGARSIVELYADRERALARRRPPLTRDVVRQATGIRALDRLAEPSVEVVDSSCLPEKLVFRPEPGIVLPALHWPGGAGRPVLLASDAGMPAAVTEARMLHAQGHSVLLLDVRDSGETRTNIWRFAGADYYIAYMLGRSWLAMRAEDLLVSARWLAQRERQPSVQLLARGEIGPPAMHAAALEPKLIESLRTDGALASWQTLMTSTDAYQHLHNAVAGALKYYDLPDLQDLSAPP